MLASFDVAILALFFRSPPEYARGEELLRARLYKRTVIAGCLCLVVAGCGTKAASGDKPVVTRTASATPRPTVTSLTPELKSYAELSDDVLKSGIAQSVTLIKEMQNTATNQLGPVCVQAADSLSSNRDAFDQIPAPLQAKKMYNVAKQAYQHALASTDECGIAADSNKPDQMAQAASDLRSAISQMTSVESTLASWRALH